MSKTAMKLALEALNTTESDCGSRAWEREQEAITALQEALAEQPAQQEPKQSDIFCGVDFADGMLSVSVLRRRADDVAELLHAEQIELPAQRTWVGLTDDERDDLLDTYITAEGRARAIEAKLKEKNT